MLKKTLLVLGVLWFTPAFAARSAYVCTPESDASALLGETVTLQGDDEQAALSSEAIGHCTVGEEGDLRGEQCAVAEEVGVEFDDALAQGEDEGSLYAASEDDETVYSCEIDRR